MMKRMMSQAAWQGNQKVRLLVSIAHNNIHISLNYKLQLMVNTQLDVQ